MYEGREILEDLEKLEALAQIEKNLYDAPYMADPRPKVKVGVRFTCAKHTITSWKTAR